MSVRSAMTWVSSASGSAKLPVVVVWHPLAMPVVPVPW
jgi:hypothetical protein